MNTLLGVVWGLVNPDMFQSVADTLEDVMQASVPGIIENVRVAEINQGSNPIRILSLRALPDEHMKDMKQAIHEENKKTKDPQEAAAVLEPALELSPAAAKRTSQHQPVEKVLPLEPRVLKDIQNSANWMLEQKVIPKRVDITSSICPNTEKLFK